MSEIKWRDVTSYSSGINKEPKVWNARISPENIESIIIIVHRFIGSPDQWFLSCDNIKLKNELLVSKDINEAKKEALIKISRKLKKLKLFYAEIIKIIDAD